MSQEILENNVASEPTPGEQHFPPFEASQDIIALADERISHYPESKLSAVLPLIHIVQHKHITGIDRTKLSHHHPIVVSPCGNYSVEFAECLASCGSAPVCLVNDDFHENIKPENAQELINKYQP